MCTIIRKLLTVDSYGHETLNVLEILEIWIQKN